jgi:3-dehydroquinate dehydratase II
MKLLIINGPNLNMLGTREPGIYGTREFGSFLDQLRRSYPDIDLDHFQSNVEGEIVTAVQKAGAVYDGIILNAGGYTHTSVAIADAVASIRVPVVEVHISNIFAREPFRHITLLGPYVKGIITGFGLESYRLAMESFRTR